LEDLVASVRGTIAEARILKQLDYSVAHAFGRKRHRSIPELGVGFVVQTQYESQPALRQPPSVPWLVSSLRDHQQRQSEPQRRHRCVERTMCDKQIDARKNLFLSNEPFDKYMRRLRAEDAGILV
jgi:hypothetical protein